MNGESAGETSDHPKSNQVAIYHPFPVALISLNDHQNDESAANDVPRTAAYVDAAAVDAAAGGPTADAAGADGEVASPIVDVTPVSKSSSFGAQENSTTLLSVAPAASHENTTADGALETTLRTVSPVMAGASPTHDVPVQDSTSDVVPAIATDSLSLVSHEPSSTRLSPLDDNTLTNGEPPSHEIPATAVTDPATISPVTSSLPIALPAPEEANPDLDTSGDLFLSPPRQGVTAIKDALEAGTAGALVLEDALDVGTKGALELEDPSCTGSEACPVSAFDGAVENEEFGEEGESQLCSHMTESQLSRRTSRNTKRKNSKEPARGGKNLRSHGEENQGERQSQRCAP